MSWHSTIDMHKHKRILIFACIYFFFVCCEWPHATTLLTSNENVECVTAAEKKSNNLSAVDGDGGGRITFHTTSTCQKQKNRKNNLPTQVFGVAHA